MAQQTIDHHVDLVVLAVSLPQLRRTGRTVDARTVLRRRVRLSEHFDITAVAREFAHQRHRSLRRRGGGRGIGTDHEGAHVNSSSEASILSITTGKRKFSSTYSR